MPALPLSAARLGSGSDVLGLDDALSRDHDWGLRLTLVVPGDAAAPVAALLDARLPEEFCGLPVALPVSWDPAVRHRVEAVSAAGLSSSRAGVDATRPLPLLDHLALTGQAALELTAGPVFRDDGGVLRRVRDRLEQPEDVRLWCLASAWQRIAEELPFVGRAGARGDALGSAVIAARLAVVAMRIAFLVEGRRAPYAKWLGTAFAALPNAEPLLPPLTAAVAPGDWRSAERALVEALEVLGDALRTGGCAIDAPVTTRFWSRPYRGLRPIAQQLQAGIGDERLRGLPLVGPPELWTDDVRILTDHALRRRTAAALLGLEGRSDEPA